MHSQEYDNGAKHFLNFQVDFAKIKRRLINPAVAPKETDLIRLERFKSTQVDFPKSTPRSVSH